MPRTKQRTPELREQLLAVAVHTLDRDGVAGLTTRRVAQGAATSTPAVYELFGDKAGLVRAVFFEGFRRLGEALAEVDVTDDPRADVVALAAAFRAFARDQPALIEVMFSRPFAAFDPAPSETEAGRVVRDLIVGHVARGVARGCWQGDPTDIAHGLFCLVQGLAAAEATQRLGTGAISVNRRWALAVGALLDGLAVRELTRAGHAARVSLLTSGQGGGGPEIRVAGIPIHLEWSSLFLLVLFGSALGSAALIAAWVIIVLVSVLVHELGHALALRRWGVSSRIVIHAMGGVTIPTNRLPERAQRIAVSLAGPLTGMVLFGLPALLVDRSWAAPDPWDDVLYLVVLVNIGYGVINLLPVLPLDGGNVTFELLDLVTGGRGAIPTRVVSIVVASGAGLWAVSEGYVFGAVFALFFVIDNLRGLGQRREKGAAIDLQPAVVALEGGHTTKAVDLAEGVLDRSKDNHVRALAVEIAAWSTLEAGNRAGAVQILAGYPSGLVPSGHLRAFLTEPTPADQVNATVDAWLDRRFVPPRTYAHQLAAADLLDTVVDRLIASRADDAEQARMGLQHALFLGGQFDASAKLGEAMLGAGTTEPIVAYNTACAHARAGRLGRAFAWLGRAIDLGFRDQKLLADDPDLAAVRRDPRYALLRNRITGTV